MLDKPKRLSTILGSQILPYQNYWTMNIEAITSFMGNFNHFFNYMSRFFEGITSQAVISFLNNLLEHFLRG